MHVEDGVAVITLQHPPMNSLHPKLLASMFDNLQRAHSDENVKAIVVYGKKNFSAGFDIPSFVAIQKSGEALDDMNPPFNALVESGKKPTVAAIEGAAMGGGCEVAMACNGRVCTYLQKIKSKKIDTFAYFGPAGGSGMKARLD
jgi:enoyl-CoA hydratase/carnithine racemase